jgi:Reverse transcriptase (RNA-dependent DNA polymerase)/gag-polypeptide of LTR copia-type/GAG-pre-integrase domain
MTTTSKLGDEFLRIPKLDVSGSNWVLYKERFFWALDARAILDHVDGKSAEPADPISEKSREANKLTEEEKELEKQWKKELREWKQGEAVAKQQIASSIPDSLFMKIRAKSTAYEIWKELEGHFQNRSRMVSIDLRRRIQDLRCAEKGDMVAHFATLRTMREDLAAMGQPLSEDDFYAIILGSLPASYDPYISAVNATSSVLGKTISADDLMLTVTEEYERRSLKNKSGKKEENAAFYSNDSDKDGKGGSKKDKKKNVECHNCHKKGHYKSECWGPGGGKEGEGPKQKGKGKSKKDEKKDEKKETGASAETKGKEKEKEVEAAWMAMIEAIESEGEQDDDENERSGDEGLCWSDFEDVEYPIPNNIADTLRDPKEATLDHDLDEFDVVPEESAYSTTLDAETLAGSADTRSNEVDLYDSGASRHMSGFRHKFIDLVEIKPIPITAADKRTFQATGKGKLLIHIPNGDKGISKVHLLDALYSPSMGVTLVSVSKIAKAGSTVVFQGNYCRIYNQDKDRIGEIPERNGLYRVFMMNSEAHANSVDVEDKLSVNELHRRLGHISQDRAKLLIEKGLVEGVALEEGSEPIVCESCEWAKTSRKPVTKVREGERCGAVGDEIHTDLWGPAPVESIGKKKYYISFTDDHSRHTSVFFLRSKDEAFEWYKIFEAWLSTQYRIRIRCLNSDRGGEFMSDEFSDHLRRAGTSRRLTVHDTPEHNGVAERGNRTNLEIARAMLHDSGLPKFLWPEAVSHAVYVRNRTWTRAIGNTTPYELLTGRKPNIRNLQPWGCQVRVHNDNEDKSKLDGRSRVGRWMGFDPDTKDGHRVYWPEKRSVSVERSVKFNVTDEAIVRLLPIEGETPINTTTTTSPSEKSTVAPRDFDVVQNVEEPEGGRGKRVRKESEYMRMLNDGSATTGNKSVLPKGMRPIPKPTPTIDEEVEEHAMASVIESAEGLMPSYQEALRRPDWPKWKEAINKELDSLKNTGTYELVKRTPEINVVDSKWVLRIKKNSAGEIEKYKARLVARGFTQIYGVDYYETYAPVARLSSFRILLAIAARNGWPIHSFDFDTAYLNSELKDDEVIYIEQPPGHETKDRKEWVWRLWKALYGLKQAARSWYESLCKALEELGFTRIEADHGVFIKRMGRDVIILAVHVDDCAVIGNSQDLIDKFMVEMNRKYRLTDTGPASWLLGIKISRDFANKTLSLSQHTYIDSIITRYNFNDLKPLATPIDPAIPLSKTQSPSKLEDIAKMKNVPYREAVGSLMYAAMGTRPDIAFATSTVAQFSNNPGWTHWEAVKRIFRYLLGTKKLELVYGGDRRGLVGYVDADGASQDHRRAISGYVFMIDGGAVSWSSKKQELVTLSTAEAEYVAQTHAAKEAIWLRGLLTELFGPLDGPTTLFSDSMSAIALAQDGHYHARTKHIDIRYHFIRYIIEEGTIKLVYCSTDDMTADTLTKALPSTKAKHFASALGLSTV